VKDGSPGTPGRRSLIDRKSEGGHRPLLHQASCPSGSGSVGHCCRVVITTQRRPPGGREGGSLKLIFSTLVALTTRLAGNHGAPERPGDGVGVGDPSSAVSDWPRPSVEGNPAPPSWAKLTPARREDGRHWDSRWRCHRCLIHKLKRPVLQSLPSDCKMKETGLGLGSAVSCWFREARILSREGECSSTKMLQATIPLERLPQM
jgi:hypothetical protein